MNNNQLLLTGKYLLPTSRQKDVILDGGVLIEGDSIKATGTREMLMSEYPRAERLHEEHGLIMPGLINTHTHAPMSCFRGFADDLPLMTWLQDHIFPVETQLTAEMVYTSSLLSMVEMIKTGTTSFCDMYLFAKEVAKASQKTGMRAWIGEVLYDFPSPNYGEVDNGFTYMDQLFAEYENNQTITITVDAHSVYTCSPELIQRLHNYSSQKQSLFVIHLSENEAEVENCKNQFGCSPVQHLDKLGVLNSPTLAAHCVNLDNDDITTLHSRDVKISHCIESNMKLASGIAPIPDLLKMGITVSIGTDGSASNNDVDMFGEMNSVAKVHKVNTMDPTVMSAEQTLEMATRGGARALGREKDLGTLEPGKKADCIILDLNKPHLTPIYNIPSHLVYVARGNDVVHSIINGKMVMQGKKLLTIDETEIIKNMKVMAKKISQIRDEKSI